jgi:hypothetical protein
LAAYFRFKYFMNQTLAHTTIFTSWVKRCTAAGLAPQERAHAGRTTKSPQKNLRGLFENH